MVDPHRARAKRRPRRGLSNRLRHALGMRQVFVVDGVRYREITIEPLRRALSRKGTGTKEYDVTFADGSTMRIRCTAQRVYADLMESRLTPVCEAADEFLRPGMRVLVINGGTGDAGAHIAGRVAPSGAVVSLEMDEESVEFAQRRYRLPNASFERGGIEGLNGETDGAFNAVVAFDPDGPRPAAESVLGELWRVVAPGGALVIAASAGDPEALLTRVSALDGGCRPRLLGEPQGGWTIAAIERASEEST